MRTQRHGAFLSSSAGSSFLLCITIFLQQQRMARGGVSASWSPASPEAMRRTEERIKQKLRRRTAKSKKAPSAAHWCVCLFILQRALFVEQSCLYGGWIFARHDSLARFFVMSTQKIIF